MFDAYKTVIGMSVLGLILILVAFTTWYTVDESEQAVVITFGQANSTVTEPGLHFKMPWPIQQVEIIVERDVQFKVWL